MPDGRPQLTRADLPAEITAETIRDLPIGTLRRLARHDNGILTPPEQAAFDAVVHEVMSQAAGRMSRQLGRADWQRVRQEANRQRQRGGRATPPSRVEEQLRRIAERIDQQVDVAEALAPGVDWSFAQGDDAPPATDAPDPDRDAGSDSGTVSDLEERLNEQVELVQVMTEIAEVSKRTYALEQQRDLQSTRGLFFGLVVSVAVLVAGWAPLVAADDWTERWWILGLTVATCVVGGLGYALVRRRQNARDDAEV